MNHGKLAIWSESYTDYLESVATSGNPLEMLQAILWHMDEDDKLNILESACRDVEFDVFTEFEYDEFLADHKYRISDEEEEE